MSQKGLGREEGRKEEKTERNVCRPCVSAQHWPVKPPRYCSSDVCHRKIVL